MSEGVEEFEQQTDSLDEVVHSQPIFENMKNHTRYDEVCKPTTKYVVKDLIQQNDQTGIRPSKTYQALANAAGGPANLTLTEKDVRNYITHYLHIVEYEIDPKELLKHFS
ncbi:hypothetical protein Ahy_B10g101793 [Arachis hypogaea]|uniref:Uncharacterized protein n=1 Tax=Arachis hypogaea TaxID=3818 RepID=A0A444X0E0_ARAHY|nr:hypothetical protein Ahy_B10g101793 [Arachis hypogaea]